MTLLAIKGTYQNGQITLEEEVITDQPAAVVVNFLAEQPVKSKGADWDAWFASIKQFSDDFMANGREQPLPQERDCERPSLVN